MEAAAALPATPWAVSASIAVGTQHLFVGVSSAAAKPWEACPPFDTISAYLGAREGSQMRKSKLTELVDSLA